MGTGGACVLHLPFILCLFFLRLYGFQDLLNKARLGDCAQDFEAVVDHGFGDALHLVALRKVDELGDFDDIGSDMLVFNG